MANWYSEWRADQVAKDRLVHLREFAVREINAVNNVPGEGTTESFVRLGLARIEAGFRSTLHEGYQISEVSKLRIEYTRHQQLDETLHERARQVLTCMVLNIEAEIQAIDQRTNFRIALASSCLSALSVIVAVGSSILGLIALFK